MQVSTTGNSTFVFTNNPCIAVSKTCNTVTIGQANLVTAVVTNCGNVTLTNISVVDNLYGTVGSIASLAPGGSATLTKSVTNTCGSFPDMIGRASYSIRGTQVSAT